ncbi:MAG: CC/Se motif family (seleno)protein [Mycobacterium leprae]
MEIILTPAARSLLTAEGATAVTVSSVVFSSCCSGPLDPAAEPGPPRDAEGYRQYGADGVTLFLDSLLEPAPSSITIDAKNYGKYQELVVSHWA